MAQRWIAWMVLAGFAQNHAAADDWPQWLGPDRASVWREKGVVKAFPKQGLPVRWRTPVHGGYAGPAVAGNKVYLTDYVRTSDAAPNDPNSRTQMDGSERVLCLDAKTGEVLWKHEYRCPYEISYPAGPRCTPSVDESRVYTLGAEGNLFCLNGNTGAVIWSKDFKKDYSAQTPLWGFCGHPLIDGEKLICLVGGEGSVAVAFDKHTGKELWRALSATESGYCPPTIIEAGGTRQAIIWHADAINGLDPESGRVFWSIPLKPSYGMSITTPRKYGNVLFASGIGNVGALIELDRTRPAAKVLWHGKGNTAVYCANSTPFIDDGVIYGCCCRNGQLRGVELKTGRRLWETFQPTTGSRRASHGTAFIVRHEDRYFLFSETGDLILADLSPQGYRELGRFHVLDPTHEAFGRLVLWSHPAFANRCVFARNDKELVCVSLAADE